MIIYYINDKMHINVAFIILLGICITLVYTPNATNATNSTNDPTCQYGLKPKVNIGLIDCHICCHHTCESCDICTNMTNVTSQKCCGITIRESGRTCDNYAAPCFINSTEACETPNKEDNNDESSDSEFGIDEMLNIAKYVGYGAAALCGTIFIIYVCCFFGDKKPPVEYADIVGKFD